MRDGDRQLERKRARSTRKGKQREEERERTVAHTGHVIKKIGIPGMILNVDNTTQIPARTRHEL